MANEIQISAVTGLTITLQLYDGATSVGSTFSAAEISTTGEYVASMPGGVPYGRYMVLATVGAGVKIASGEILWDGYYELIPALATIQGLDPNNPSTTTPLTWDAGSIAIDITGDGVNTTTMTRQP